MNPVLKLWAKSEPPHPLWCHLIDVGAVAEAMWDHVFTKSTKRRLRKTLGLDHESIARGWIVWLAALHDIGKATPEFQHQHEILMKQAESAGFVFTHKIKKPHGIFTSFILREELKARNVDKISARALGQAVGVHHGKMLGPDKDTKLSDGLWREAPKDLVCLVEEGLDLGITRKIHPQNVSLVGVAELAGFVSYVDWIGSATEYFSDFGDGPALFAGAIDISEYTEKARENAKKALRKFGWKALPQIAAEKSWRIIFGADWSPNPLQNEVTKILQNHPETRIILIEAPMGEGKTEAALYSASHWLGQFSQPGVYLGLPTQATSNAMYERVDGWLERFFSKNTVESLLVHGGLIHPEYYTEKKAQTQRYESFGMQEFENDEDSQSVIKTTAHDWFFPSKRALLAPFGTGTIDQALIGVLTAKHWFVRLAGLAGKTIIFDEVHAYDAYTSRLMERLLEFLSLLGCTVILLSATLPTSKRKSLLKAFTGEELESPAFDGVPYPRISAWAPGNQIESIIGFETSDRAKKKLKLESIPWDLEASVSAFVDKLGEAGCGAYILNTVDDAQKVFEKLKSSFPSNYFEQLLLFHSRFPAMDRARLEKRVLDCFGKKGNRPKGRAILIATQVVEQSLDLDFDLMASTIAPIDLLLQRSGRLHRHHRERPSHHHEPTLLIRIPTSENEAPKYEKNENIYSRAILLRTHAVISQWMDAEKRMEIPESIPRMIDEVYESEFPDGLPDSWKEDLKTADCELAKQIEDEQNQGEGRLQFSPNDRDISELWIRKILEMEDDLNSTGARRALTRLGDESISTILVIIKDERMYLDLEAKIPLPDPAPSEGSIHKDITMIVERIVNLPAKLIKKVEFSDPPASWQRHRILKNLKVLTLNSNGMTRNNGIMIHWRSDLGVRIQWDK